MTLTSFWSLKKLQGVTVRKGACLLLRCVSRSPSPAAGALGPVSAGGLEQALPCLGRPPCLTLVLAVMLLYSLVTDPAQVLPGPLLFMPSLAYQIKFAGSHKPRMGEFLGDSHTGMKLSLIFFSVSFRLCGLKKGKTDQRFC